MTAPAVSVVIAARNAETWIGATLASVLGQICPLSTLEIIVVDDGSTDRTAAIAREVLAEGGLEHQILVSRDGTGPSAARNRGWRRARGAWIQFLDADDILAPHKIAHQLLVAADTADDVALVFSTWGRLLQRGDAWVQHDGRTRPVIGDDPLRDLLAPDNFIATGSQIFRRAWIERMHGFVESYRLIEDVDLMMRIVMAGGRLVEAPADAPLFWYRRHAGSASRQDRLAFAHASMRNTRAAEDWWQAAGALTPGRSTYLAELYSGAARVFAEQDPAAFDAALAHLTRLCPGFVPSEPAALRRLSRLIGYRRAETWSVWYRRLKRRTRSGWGELR